MSSPCAFAWCFMCWLPCSCVTVFNMRCQPWHKQINCHGSFTGFPLLAEVSFLFPPELKVFLPQVFPLLRRFLQLHSDGFSHLPPGISWHLWILILWLWLLFLIPMWRFMLKNCSEELARNAQESSTVQNRPIIITVGCYISREVHSVGYKVGFQRSLWLRCTYSIDLTH